MKELPEYMNKILNFMAECEEKQGGLKKEEAYKLYKQELFDESLTAKANPGKLDSCVDQVKKKDSKYNAYAVCRAALKKNPKAVKEVVDALIQEGKSAEEIHEFLLDNNFRGSLAALKKYMKNPNLSKGKSAKDFDQVELQKGTQVEMEHTDDPMIAERIAMDHLTEDKDYYKKLAKMEAGACDIPVEGNPSYKEFQEIYDLVAEKFNDSPLAQYLGKLKKGLYKNQYLKAPKETYAASGRTYENNGRAFFEEIRKFAVSATDKIYESSMFGKKNSRQDIFFFNSASGKIESGKKAKHKSDRQYLGSREIPKLLGSMTSKDWELRQKQMKAGLLTSDEVSGRDERTDQLIEIEADRYLKLMLESIIFAMNEKLFELDKAKITKLLESSLPLLFDLSISPQTQRKVYAWANSEEGRSAYTYAMLGVIRNRLLTNERDLFAPLTSGEKNRVLKIFFDLRDAPMKGQEMLLEFKEAKKKGR